MSVDTLTLLSPITIPCRVVAQMTNYASHAKDSGMNPKTVPLTFFRKASGSITGPNDDVVRPRHVHFLDYEAEVGLVFGRELPVGTAIDNANLADYVAGLVIANDVSARDLQLPKTQFFESKSYPTFTPTGPVLLLLDPGELTHFDDLHLRLWVSGELRQDAIVGEDIIFGPVEAVAALTRFQRLDPGDVLLTGTPAGTALKAPPMPLRFIANTLPPALRWRAFFKAQARSGRYLKNGDVIEVAIASDDRDLDLGRQSTRVRYAS